VKIIVFGGAGFIGKALLKKLIHAGHSVACADNYITSKKSDLDSSGIKQFDVDITDKKALSSIDFAPDIVIHLAFPTSKCNRSPENQFEVIASSGMLNVLNYTKYTCNRIVYASSISVYGIPKQTPINELNEVNPILIYGANKFMNEQYIQCYNKEFGTEYNIIRVSDTFGEFDKRSNAVNNFIKSYIHEQPIRINGSGNQIRTFTYVEDIAQAFLLAIEQMNNTHYNVASDYNTSINNLVDCLKLEFKKEISKTYYHTVDDERNYIFDCLKFKNDFGNFERVGFHEGLKRTVAHLQLTTA